MREGGREDRGKEERKEKRRKEGTFAELNEKKKKKNSRRISNRSEVITSSAKR